VYDTETEETRKARPKDVTILFRARTRLPQFERALDVWDVPYTVASGTGFWDTPEIRNLVVLFEVLANPDDDVALYGLLRSPLFGFTDDKIAHPAASGARCGQRFVAETETLGTPRNKSKGGENR